MDNFSKLRSQNGNDGYLKISRSFRMLNYVDKSARIPLSFFSKKHVGLYRVHFSSLVA